MSSASTPDLVVSANSLPAYTLEAIFRFARARGLIAPDEELTAHRTGRAKRLATDPQVQFITLSLPNPATGKPVTSVELLRELSSLFEIPYEVIDTLTLDATLVTNVIGKEFAEKRLVLPLRKDAEGHVVLAVGNPLDKDAMQTVGQLLTAPVELRLVYPGDLFRVTREYHGLKKNLAQASKAVPRASERVSNLEQLLRFRSEKEIEQSDEHIINAVELLFRYAMDQRASDIHFEPKRVDGLIRMRIDGVMHTIHKVPMTVYRAIVSRVKTISRMDIAERRRPQDGRIKISDAGREIEMRVSTLPVVFGEKIVTRLFDPGNVVDDFAKLGFRPDQDELLQAMLRSGNGMMIVTGPTGSGKTSTLYCALQQLAKRPVNIVTIEDPVEMVIDTLNQVAIQPAIGLGYAESLRTILRQDPDIIMVGEIRDSETARYAVQAALTGHLVLTTLHTNDSIAAIGRLLDLGVDRFFLAQVVRGITAQRLVRRVCPQCAITTQLARAEVDSLGLAHYDPSWTATRGSGCDSCRNTGYRGRTTINEILPFSPKVADLVYDGAAPDVLAAAARDKGFQTLAEAALDLILTGATTPEEAYRVLSGIG